MVLISWARRYACCWLPSAKAVARPSEGELPLLHEGVEQGSARLLRGDVDARGATTIRRFSTLGTIAAWTDRIRLLLAKRKTTKPGSIRSFVFRVGFIFLRLAPISRTRSRPAVAPSRGFGDVVTPIPKA